MIRSASELRAAARVSLSGKWGGAVVITLIYLVVMGVVPGFLSYEGSERFSSLVQLLLLPLAFGLNVAFLDNIRSGADYKIEQLLVGFRDYTRVLGTALLAGIYIFLWSLLLIVPGIIKAYSYAMTFYVLRDHPELKYNGAIERSMKMMAGHKFDLFYLQLTFIGWGLLCVLTLGIGYLWLAPYMQASFAHFYEDVRADYESRIGEVA